MYEHHAKSGKLIYYATRHELEALPRYRGNDRKGRACCPVHNGDNPTALSIDWVTGWATCWSCGDAFSIRIGDPPSRGLTATARPASTPYPPRANPALKCPQNVHKGDGTLQANLTTAIAAASERLPGSPGETYLTGRHIPLDIAQALGIGWVSTGPLAGRVVFPLCGPDGCPTSVIGRVTNDHAKPKYKALASEDGYVKTLFNGTAIAQARRSGHPVVVVEGPLDAAACVAAGIPLTVALCGKAYTHPEHFDGVSTVILALDADDAGQEGRRRLWLDLTARGLEVLVLPAAALTGAKDLCEYWQQHHAMPVQLVTRAIGPHLHDTPAMPLQDLGTVPKPAIIVEGAGAATSPAMTPDDLPDDLKTEAEALAVELAGDAEALEQFGTELHQRAHLLTAEDQCAAHYALTLAAASCPDLNVDDD